MTRSRRFRNLAFVFRGTFGLIVLGCLASLTGCERGGSADHGRSAGGSRVGHYQKELFAFAIDNLNRLEQYDSPEMQRQVVDRLNQWAQSQTADPQWKPDPLLAALSPALTKLPEVTGLGDLRFSMSDARALQEIVWIRDVAQRVRGNRRDPLNQAVAIFDWVVRNVQLDPLAVDEQGKPLPRIPQTAGETLLFGRGTAADRAWLFLLLARQQGLDAAMLALADPANPKAPPRPWLPAVLVEDEVYLFDIHLGIPVPQMGGVTADRSGQLQFRPATLAEAAGDDFVLRQLDPSADEPYPVSSSDLKQGVVALLEASPLYLSQRMKLLEQQLSGDQRMVLTVDALAQAGRWKAHPNVADARLWTMPYEIIAQLAQSGEALARERVLRALPLMFVPPLAKGRILDLKGQFDGEGNALALYQASRPSQQFLEKQRSLDDQIRLAIYLAKQDATYWLGLIAYEREQFSTAIDYFEHRTLEAFPDAIWGPSANYNLARTYEASQEFDKAIATYRRDGGSPYQRGNLLRARWLEGFHTTQVTPEKEPASVESELATPAESPAPQVSSDAMETPLPQEGEPATPAQPLEPLPGLPPL